MADEVKPSGVNGRAVVIVVETAAVAVDRVPEAEADVKAGANFSAARRSASSAWRKLKRSTTRTSARSAVCRRERQDRASAFDRGLHPSSAALVERDQAGAQYRVAAVCGTSIVKNLSLAVIGWSLANDCEASDQRRILRNHHGTHS